MSFDRYLPTLQLIHMNMSEDDHWIEQVYIDKQTNKPIALKVYLAGFTNHFIYFDEENCKELYSDEFNSTFHTFGINWYVYHGTSEEDTERGRRLIQNSLKNTIRIFDYIKVKFNPLSFLQTIDKARLFNPQISNFLVLQRILKKLE